MSCIAPIYLKQHGVDVPCGKCLECRKRRASGWSFRLRKEEERSSSSLFITLTYNNETIQKNITPNGFLTLKKRDLQLFFKRLRKSHPKHCKLKYYAVGEYGGKFRRPHYHIILFNADEELIADAWGMGNVHFGQVSAASVGYTLKYVSKKGEVPRHKRDDRLPEFQLMSKKMGDNYLTQAVRKYHKKDLFNRFCIEDEGKKLAMPRYYKDKIYNTHEKLKISAHFEKKHNEEEQLENVDNFQLRKNLKKQYLRIQKGEIQRQRDEAPN